MHATPTMRMTAYGDLTCAATIGPGAGAIGISIDGAIAAGRERRRDAPEGGSVSFRFKRWRSCSGETGRRDGSLSRHVVRNRRRPSLIGGVAGNVTGSLTMPCIKAGNDSAFHGVVPYSISYSSTPSPKTSTAADCAFPSTCSGAMYFGVPKI